MTAKNNQHLKYLKNLKKKKWVVVPGQTNGNCQHPEGESITCGKYQEAVLLVPANGKSIKVPEGYAQRSELWICPTHISDYDCENERTNL